MDSGAPRLQVCESYKRNFSGGPIKMEGRGPQGHALFSWRKSSAFPTDLDISGVMLLTLWSIYNTTYGTIVLIVQIIALYERFKSALVPPAWRFIFAGVRHRSPVGMVSGYSQNPAIHCA